MNATITVPQLSPAAQALADFVMEFDYASMVEACRVIAEHIPVHGPCALEIRHNLVIWANLSHIAIDAVKSCFEAHLIRLTTCRAELYQRDGAILSLPVAKRALSQYPMPLW